ncbi:hypothetical protein MKZ38_006324 [Zalerion maritima]|uniref:Apc15p protein-domain-containing protein n=1 Tax=Zalerion maritima TaxID=339359 RepID=A0AAD5WPP0_9PEZI|nr:hypothetical protein MKZ38_006324 [Zalerion maritima]
MLGLLPDLTPRDQQQQQQQQNSPDNPNGPSANPRRQHQHVPLERSPLARLRADEQYIERRRLNVQNFGQSWLKPPGISKTLHQIREERREMEEHQEAMRREQLAAELAEAEAQAAEAAAQAVAAAQAQAQVQAAAAAAAAATGGGEDRPMADDGMGMERDLDDEVPEASDGGLGYSAANSDSEDVEDEEEEESESSESSESESESDSDSNEENNDSEGHTARRAEEQRNLQSIRAARMGMNHDAYREAIARGTSMGMSISISMGVGADGQHDDYYDNDEEEEGLDDEGRTQLFEEEDLVPDGEGIAVNDMMMDQDLDDEIPDADESGFGGGGSGYEHTDSEAELSSSSNSSENGAVGGDTTNVSFAAAGGSSAVHQHEQQGGQRWRNSMMSDATRQSIDLNSVLSRDSSLLGSSPIAQRMPGPPPRRRPS